MNVPKNDTVERAVLGALCLNPALIPVVEEILPVEACFDSAQHQAIYRAVRLLNRRRASVDWVTISTELVKLGETRVLGGKQRAEDYIRAMAEEVPDPEAVEQYAREVRELWLRRSVLFKLREIAGAGINPQNPILQVLSQLQGETNLLMGTADYRPPARIGDLANDLLERLADQKKMALDGTDRGLYSGWGPLDELLFGFRPGQLIIIGARPRDGKTTIALNILDNIASTAAIRLGTAERGGGLMQSLEMMDTQLAEKLVCAAAAVDATLVRLGKTTNEQEAALEREASKLSGRRIWIDDQAGLTLPQIRARAIIAKDRDGIEILIVDYLQKIAKVDRREQQTPHVSDVVQGMKQIAKDLRIPVICLAQLNRSIEARAGKQAIPRMSDLRDSGVIEQEADVIILLDPKRSEATGVGDNYTVPTDLIVAKQREGREGVIRLNFRKALSRFEVPPPPFTKGSINAIDFKPYTDREAVQAPVVVEPPEKPTH